MPAVWRRFSALRCSKSGASRLGLAGFQRCSKRQEAGFTLLELLIVVVIIGLALGMVALHGRGGDPRLALEAAATRIGDTLSAARSEAILHDRPVRVTVNGQGRLPPEMRESFAGPQKNSIVFQGDGSASGGVITLAGKGGQAKIAVDWLTGRIRVTED